ncbi:uncharacterized protein LY89DRAFT_130462 [Mollisia scopiformis]|uniref:Uncharacterized protein n=1 Tax=Mollisia scopiformis TaxID=149040 RepID=A0A194X1R6_MOLSC|nr:uncharacterized protein LY89DRAFT_130462 [Mollisia scopiformis]KUJ14140.1 hypothetical protein LY89DRAFT_130462 [Mollisia scopiformis]
MKEEIHDDSTSSATSSKSPDAATPSEQDQRSASMPEQAIRGMGTLNINAIVDMWKDAGLGIQRLEWPSLLEESRERLFEDDGSVAGNTNADEMPDLSQKTVNLLVAIYETDINTMHPILIPSLSAHEQARDYDAEVTAYRPFLLNILDRSGRDSPRRPSPCQ